MTPLRATRYAGQARLSVIMLLAPALAGCDMQTFKSSVAGTCPAFEAPAYVVKGQRQYDQDWIDGNVEAGIGACNWARPQPRPAAIEAGANIARAAPVKPRGMLKRAAARVKKSIWPAPSAVPSAPLPEPEPEPAAAPEPPAPPPKPRDPVDELLQPDEPARKVP